MRTFLLTLLIGCFTADFLLGQPTAAPSDVYGSVISARIRPDIRRVDGALPSVLSGTVEYISGNDGWTRGYNVDAATSVGDHDFALTALLARFDRTTDAEARLDPLGREKSSGRHFGARAQVVKSSDVTMNLSYDHSAVKEGSRTNAVTVAADYETPLLVHLNIAFGRGQRTAPDGNAVRDFRKGGALVFEQKVQHFTGDADVDNDEDRALLTKWSVSLASTANNLLDNESQWSGEVAVSPYWRSNSSAKVGFGRHRTLTLAYSFDIRLHDWFSSPPR